MTCTRGREDKSPEQSRAICYSRARRIFQQCRKTMVSSTGVHTWLLPDWLVEVRGCSACQRSSLALRSSSSLLSISRMRTSRLSCFTAATSDGSMPSVITAPKRLASLRDRCRALLSGVIWLYNASLLTCYNQQKGSQAIEGGMVSHIQAFLLRVLLGIFLDK